MNLPFFLARNVARGGTRSVSRTIIGIAVAAVTISMATMVVASALISGFKTEISDKIFGFWGHIHITTDAASYSVMDTYLNPVSTDQDFYPSLDTLRRITVDPLGGTLLADQGETRTSKGGVKHIQQFIVLPGVASVYQENERLPVQEALILKGIAEDYDWETFDKYIVEGRPLRVVADSSSREIVVSSITAKRMRLGLEDRVDFTFIDPVTMRERTRKFTVTGIYKTGLEEFDRQFAIVDIKQPRSLLGWSNDQVGGFEVILDDLEDLEMLSTYIMYEVLPQHLYAESIKRKISELFKWLEIQDYNQAIILALMIVVAIINMMTALLILILERTNMIGTLKALGQSNWSIRQIFLYYAAFIVIGGVLLGNFVGLSLCWLQKTFELIKLDEESYYLAVAPIKVDWLVVVGLNVGTLVITLLFLVVPSYLVTRIDPVKAIRFK